MGTNSVIMSLQCPKQLFLGWKVSSYVINNQESIKREFWGEHGIDSTPETEEKGDNVKKQDVAQKGSDKDDQNPITPVLPGKKKTGDDSDGRKKSDTVVDNTSYVDSQKEAKDPPIFSRKQKIAIAIGVVTALATALVCYSLQLPALAIVASTLIAGIGAYVVSSKLYDISIFNGTGQQPGL